MCGTARRRWRRSALTLAKRIVEAHGGTIELVSGTGKGTRARVSVPVPAPVRP
jgi:signal transduction histidine kinase